MTIDGPPTEPTSGAAPGADAGSDPPSVYDAFLDRTSDGGSGRELPAHVVADLVQVGRVEEAIVYADIGLRLAGPRADLLHQRGLALRRLARDREAVESLRWAFELEPSHPVALSLGWAFYAIDRYDRCGELAHNVLVDEPEHVQALLLAAEAARMRQQFDEATTLNDRLVELAPDDAVVFEQRSRLFAQRGDMPGRAAAAERWVAADPSSAPARVFYATSLLERGRLEDAEAHYDEALRLDPYEPKALVAKVRILLGRDADEASLDEGLGLLDRAVEHGDDRIDPEVLGLRAQVLFTLGRLDEAIVALDVALERSPSNGLRLLLAEAYARTEQWAAAAAEFDRLDASLLEAGEAANYVTALRITNQLDRAATVGDAALVRAPDHVRLLSERAEVARLMDTYDLALQLLDRAIANHGDGAWQLGTKSQVLTSMGRYNEAIEVVDDALAKPSPPTWVLNVKGDALRMAGRYREALDCFDTVLAAEPDNSVAAVTRAEAQRMVGDPAGALAAAEQLLERMPDDVFLLGTRAAALQDLLRAGEALTAAEHLLQIAPSYEFAWRIKVSGLASLDRSTEAIATLDAMDQAIPGPTDWSLAQRSALLSQLGRWDDVLALADSCPDTATMTNGATIEWCRGLALSNLGDHADAVEHLELAAGLQRTPPVDGLAPREPMPGVLADLADTLDLLGDHTRARAEREHAVASLTRLTDPPPDGLDVAAVAWASFVNGDADTAVRRFQQALTMVNRGPTWQFAIAMIALAKGFDAMANEQLRGFQATMRATSDMTRRAALVAECRRWINVGEAAGCLGELTESDHELLASHLERAAVDGPTSAPS